VYPKSLIAVGAGNWHIPETQANSNETARNPLRIMPGSIAIPPLNEKIGISGGRISGYP
jgi:hypothetical protein